MNKAMKIPAILFVFLSLLLIGSSCGIMKNKNCDCPRFSQQQSDPPAADIDLPS
jgi:hypothetical protein